MQKEKTFKRMLRRCMRKQQKNMQMEMPAYATYLHAVVQLVVGSLYLRSGIIPDLTSTDDGIFTYMHLVKNAL